MYELLLQNVQWQREINYSWLEFTRQGIQQIILTCRLYYIKNPIVRRLVDVCAQYVFARGVDVSTDDDDANDVIKAFFERNQRVLGKVALLELPHTAPYEGVRSDSKSPSSDTHSTVHSAPPTSTRVEAMN